MFLGNYSRFRDMVAPKGFFDVLINDPPKLCKFELCELLFESLQILNFVPFVFEVVIWISVLNLWSEFVSFWGFVKFVSFWGLFVTFD